MHCSETMRGGENIDVSGKMAGRGELPPYIFHHNLRIACHGKMRIPDSGIIVSRSFLTWNRPKISRSENQTNPKIAIIFCTSCCRWPKSLARRTESRDLAIEMHDLLAARILLLLGLANARSCAKDGPFGRSLNTRLVSKPSQQASVLFRIVATEMRHFRVMH